MPPTVSTSLFDQFARGWRSYLLVALIALASSLFGAGQVPVMDSDEASFVQATRQMIESDDYLRIRLQQSERNAKPAGAHWLQALSVHLFEPMAERLNVVWPYRMPSALGIVLAALATLWGGTALIGHRAALFGAGLLGAGMLAGFEGMTAKTDALLLGFTTLALAALARLHAGASEGRRARWLGLLAWIAIACGFLIKGPVTALVVALTLAALGLWERRVRWMAPLLWWPGPLAALLIVAPWAIAISDATSGRFFGGMFFGDIAPKLLGGDDGHYAPPGYHLLLLPFLIFPAAYALPAAGRLGWSALRAPRSDAAQARYRFLVAWAAPTFLFFELAPTKLAHYALPAYPAIALLCGAGLLAMRGRRWRTAHPAGIVLFAVSGAVLVALMAMTATLMPGGFDADVRRAVATALVGSAIVAAALTALLLLLRAAARAGVLIVCALALSFSLRERLLPETHTLFVSNEAVAALTRARLLPRDDRQLWAVGYDAPSLIFLTRTSIRMASPAEAGRVAEQGDAMLVEGRMLEETAAELALRGLRFAPAEPVVRGLALGRGERVALFAGRVELAPVSGE